MPRYILAVDAPTQDPLKKKPTQKDAYITFALFTVTVIAIIAGCVIIHKLREWMKEEGMLQ